MAEGDSELGDLYRDVLLDYYRSRARKGKLASPDRAGHGVNPICGDEIELTASCPNGRLEKVLYQGHGCVISQASAAMMAEALEGKTPGEAEALIEDFRRFMLDKNLPVDSLSEPLSELGALDGVRKFPVRIKCALLAWNTMKLGLQDGAAREAQYQEAG